MKDETIGPGNIEQNIIWKTIVKMRSDTTMIMKSCLFESSANTNFKTDCFSMLYLAIYLAIYLAGYLIALGIPQTLIHAHSALGRRLEEKRKKRKKRKKSIKPLNCRKNKRKNYVLLRFFNFFLLF